MSVTIKYVEKDGMKMPVMRVKTYPGKKSIEVIVFNGQDKEKVEMTLTEFFNLPSKKLHGGVLWAE